MYYKSEVHLCPTKYSHLNRSESKIEPKLSKDQSTDHKRQLNREKWFIPILSQNLDNTGNTTKLSTVEPLFTNHTSNPPSLPLSSVNGPDIRNDLGWKWVL